MPTFRRIAGDRPATIMAIAEPPYGGSAPRNGMLTGELKNQVDRIWDTFWAGGIANPLEVMEQITYLLFLRRLDDLQTLEENRANRLEPTAETQGLP